MKNLNTWKQEMSNWRITAKISTTYYMTFVVRNHFNNFTWNFAVSKLDIIYTKDFFFIGFKTNFCYHDIFKNVTCMLNWIHQVENLWNFKLLFTSRLYTRPWSVNNKPLFKRQSFQNYICLFYTDKALPSPEEFHTWEWHNNSRIISSAAFLNVDKRKHFPTEVIC